MSVASLQICSAPVWWTLIGSYLPPLSGFEPVPFVRVVEFIGDYDGVCALGNIRPMWGVFQRHMFACLLNCRSNTL